MKNTFRKLLALSDRFLFLILLCLSSARVQGAIPAVALADPRYGLGYLVVTNYAGVIPDGIHDCTAGLQAAINDANANNINFEKTGANRGLAVFFPPGTYLVTNMLYCYEWQDSANNVIDESSFSLIGSTVGGGRPTIKLTNGAPAFQNPAWARPMLALVNWVGDNATPVTVTNPLVNNFTDPGTGNKYTNNEGELFYCDVRNLNFDCGGNPGAIGVTFLGSQQNTMENVKVNATNAYCGFFGVPGAGSCSANLEVDGGQYGIVSGGQLGNLADFGASTSGPLIVGVTLANQTTVALFAIDSVAPTTVAGFNITNCTGFAVQTTENPSWRLMDACLTLLDGQINIGATGNPWAYTNITNPDTQAGFNAYLRNVYFSGTKNLMKSGITTLTTPSATTWTRVEYAYNCTLRNPYVPPNTGYTNTINYYNDFDCYSVLNGLVASNATPVLVLTTNTPPPSNLISEHLPAAFPSFNMDPSDPATLIVATNIAWNKDTNDDTAALQAAIDSAAAANGRVFLPAGMYYITNTLTLHTNTVLLGVGRQLSEIKVNPLWQPTSGMPTMINTSNDMNATTTLAYMTFFTPGIGTQSLTNYGRFTMITWQAGGNSLIAGVAPQDPYTSYRSLAQRYQMIFTNNGGGRVYMGSLFGDYAGNNSGDRLVFVCGTTQPLWFYGFNLEHGAASVQSEVRNASNVRMLGMKSESGPLIMVTNSTNIAAYGFGGARSGAGSSGYFQVLGASTNILFGNLDVQSQTDGKPDNTSPILREALTGLPSVSVLWPNMISIYKRGDINDSVMFPVVTTITPPATPAGLTATNDTIHPTTQMNLAWNSVTNETGYELQRATSSGGPYSLVADTDSNTTSFNDTNLSPGTTYYYEVAAFNPSYSAFSSPVSAVTQPEMIFFSTPWMSGGKMIMTGGGASSGGSYEILTSTNPTLPLVNWTPLLTNTFAGDGSFSNGIPISPTDSQRFYCLTVNPTGAPFDYTIVQTPTAPVIDGVVDSIWSAANSAAVTNVSVGSISGPADCSGFFQAMWDTTNLYVITQVTDDIAVHDTGVALGYYDDSVEVYVDAGNTKATSYGGNDFHYGFYYEGGSNIVVELGHNATNGVVMGRTTNGANYIIEVKIPWSTVGQSPVTPGTYIGLDAQIDDNDVPGAHTRDAELQWHDNGDQDYQNPSHFGTARLSPAP